MEPQKEHTLASFDDALRESKNHVLLMASVTQQNLDNAVNGLLSRNPEICSEAIADDDEVDSFEKVIDREGMEILMRFGPVATDLRNVLSAMKIANNLERISDEAGGIAKRGRKIGKSPEVPETRIIEPLYEMAKNLLHDGIRAYAESDLKLGLSLHDRGEPATGVEGAERWTVEERRPLRHRSPH